MLIRTCIPELKACNRFKSLGKRTEKMNFILHKFSLLCFNTKSNDSSFCILKLHFTGKFHSLKFILAFQCFQGKSWEKAEWNVLNFIITKSLDILCFLIHSLDFNETQIRKTGKISLPAYHRPSSSWKVKWTTICLSCWNEDTQFNIQNFYQKKSNRWTIVDQHTAFHTLEKYTTTNTLSHFRTQPFISSSAHKPVFEGFDWAMGSSCSDSKRDNRLHILQIVLSFAPSCKEWEKHNC